MYETSLDRIIDLTTTEIIEGVRLLKFRMDCADDKASPDTFHFKFQFESRTHFDEFANLFKSVIPPNTTTHTIADIVVEAGKVHTNISFKDGDYPMDALLEKCAEVKKMQILKGLQQLSNLKDA